MYCIKFYFQFNSQNKLFHFSLSMSCGFITRSHHRVSPLNSKTVELLVLTRYCFLRRDSSDRWCAPGFAPAVHPHHVMLFNTTAGATARETE